MDWGGIKKINSDLNVPLDATLGKKTDAAGTTSSSTLFSWIKGIFNAITTINTNVNAIKTNTTQGGVSGIKSVQRGTASGSTANYSTSAAAYADRVTISVASVNMSKALLIANPNSDAESGISSMVLTSTNTITLSPYGVRGTQQGSYVVYSPLYSTTVWQLIEFY